MKEYYAVDGSMSELFLAAESDFVSGSDNRVEETELKNIFTPNWDYPGRRSRPHSVSSDHTSYRPRKKTQLK